jgi:hypothetical protein
MKYVGRVLFKSPEKASELVYDLCTSSAYDGKSGHFYSSIPNVKPSPMALSSELASQVWERSCQIVDLPSDALSPQSAEDEEGVRE